MSSVKVQTKTLLKDIKYDYDNNKLIFVFDTATGDETIEIDCDPFIRQGNGITISNGNIINVNVADESEKLADESDILVVDELGLRVRGIKDKLIKEFNLIKNDRDNNTHYYSYEYIAQNGTVYPIEIPDFVEWNNNTDQTRQIELRNNDKLVGLDVDTIIRNLIHLDGADTVQVGDSKISINLNGKEVNPTYNQQALALISNLEDEISGLHLIKEDAPTDPDIAARYYLADKDGELLGDVHIDILKDNYLKEVTYNEDTYTFTFDFWVNDDPEEPAHDKIVTFTLQKLFDNLKAIIDEVDSRLSNKINDLEAKHINDVNTINDSINNEIRPAIQENTKNITELRNDLDEEIARRDEIQQGLDNLVDKTDKLNQDLIDTNNNLAAEILRATNAEAEIYDHIHEVEATIDGKIDETEKGQPNGIATLDENGFIPSTQINGQMAHVFGVDGVATAATLPDSANEGDIYYTTDTKKFYNYNGTSWDDPMDPKDDTIYNFRNCDATGDTSRTNILYRWDGQDLTEISESLALGEVTGTAYEGNKGAANRAAINSTPASLVSTLNVSSDTSKVDINLETTTKSGLNYNAVTSIIKNVPNATKLSAGIITSTEYASLVETIPNKLVELETELDNKQETGDYVTNEELEAKDYVTKSEIPDISNLASKDEIPTKVSELENDSNFLTSIPDNYVTDTELQEAISGVQFELPVATNSVLGGIKVGAGLNITEDGILSATGGGTADAVNWENVIGRPTNLSQFTNDSGFITSDDLPDLSEYALKSELPDLSTYALKSEIPIVPTNVGSFTNDAGYITNSALTDYAKKSEIPDISGLATKSELSGYALKSHTHVVADITDFPEIPDISNLATKDEVNAKQDELVSGANIKTINGTSLLGSGNIIIESSGGGSEIMDVLDDKTYARTQGSWVDLTDYLTWAEYD